MLQKIKLILAVLLLCAICLPLGTCSQNDASAAAAAASRSKSVSAFLFPKGDANTIYAYADLPSTVGEGLLTALAFGWPLLAVFLARRLLRTRLFWLLHIFELLCVGGTVYWLYAITVVFTLLYGAYVDFTLCFLYAFVVSLQLFQAVRSARRNLPLTEAITPSG